MEKITGALASVNGFTAVGNGIPVEVYNTPSGSTNAAIGSTTMFTTPAADGNYRFSFYVTQINNGSGCTGNSSVKVQLTYNDPVSGASQPLGPGTVIVVPFNGTGMAAQSPLGPTAGLGNQTSGTFFFRAKGSTTISYQTVYTAGSGCTTNPSYEVFPLVVAY